MNCSAWIIIYDRCRGRRRHRHRLRLLRYFWGRLCIDHLNERANFHHNRGAEREREGGAQPSTLSVVLGHGNCCGAANDGDDGAPSRPPPRRIGRGRLRSLPGVISPPPPPHHEPKIVNPRENPLGAPPPSTCPRGIKGRGELSQECTRAAISTSPPRRRSCRVTDDEFIHKCPMLSRSRRRDSVDHRDPRSAENFLRRLCGKYKVADVTSHRRPKLAQALESSGDRGKHSENRLLPSSPLSRGKTDAHPCPSCP